MYSCILVCCDCYCCLTYTILGVRACWALYHSPAFSSRLHLGLHADVWHLNDQTALTHRSKQARGNKRNTNVNPHTKPSKSGLRVKHTWGVGRVLELRSSKRHSMQPKARHTAYFSADFSISACAPPEVLCAAQSRAYLCTAQVHKPVALPS